MRKKVEIPSLDQIQNERERIRYSFKYKRTLKSTVAVLIVAAALAILVATLLMPILQIYGYSMSPTLVDGEIVVSVKTNDFKSGDLIAFYYGNKLLIKRVICLSGDWIDIDESGTVFVNGSVLSEPYLTERALGECSIELPYQVPDNRCFVMGDNRAVSVDSRSTQVGCIADEQIVGKIVFKIWPLKDIGTVK